MTKLIILNLIIIIINVFICLLIKKVKDKKYNYIILLISALLTILCHYSSLLYHYIKDGSQMEYLICNPNLILPIYPCNIVMWCCLILGLKRNKDTNFSKFLIDYIFYFGIVSCLVGMFANVDFIRQPSLADYDITKGIVAHGFMLLNVMLLKTLGYVRIDFKKNTLNIFIAIIMMAVVGLYCTIVISVLGSKEYAYSVNSMFLLHSPFDGIDFLTYPVIGLISLVVYSIIFFILSKIINKKKVD